MKCKKCNGEMKKTYPLGLPKGEFLWMCAPCEINVNFIRNPVMTSSTDRWKKK